MDTQLVTPVLTKKSYYQRWLSGEFGNRPQAWGTIESLESSGYSGKVNIRHIVPDSPCIRLGIAVSRCRTEIAKMGLSVNQFKFNEPMPDHRILMQGEVCEDHRGWHLRYCCDKVTMRTAMANAFNCCGLEAKMRIRRACDASSYECITGLLDRFPGHTIEFSAFGYCVGDLRRNTIIWEVRKY